MLKKLLTLLIVGIFLSSFSLVSSGCDECDSNAFADCSPHEDDPDEGKDVSDKSETSGALTSSVSAQALQHSDNTN